LYPLGYKYIFETKFRIEVYQDSDGQSPFEDWLNSLDDKTAKAKILARITRLSYGNFGDSKPLQNADGIWEAREHYRPGFRAYFTRLENNVLLILAGSSKKNQKRAIALAKTYLKDFENRRR